MSDITRFSCLGKLRMYGHKYLRQLEADIFDFEMLDLIDVILGSTLGSICTTYHPPPKSFLRVPSERKRFH